MIIYGEYLFLENFITGVIIMYFTGKIAGKSPRLLRLLLCGIGCGAYAFTMFMAIPPLLSVLGKILFVLGISWVAFGFQPLRKLLLSGMLFFAVTVLYGGLTMALLSSFQWEGIAVSEGIYMPAATYFTVSFSAAFAVLFVALIISIIKTRRQQQRTRISVTLSMGNKNWDMEGFVDSGNFLREPFSGKPVAVVRKSMMEQMLKDHGDKTVRYMAIPYSTVGTEKGVMDGYRIDALKAGEQTIRKPILAVCEDETFLTGEKDRGQILLPESMLERGIYGDFNDNQGILSEAAKNFRKGYLLYRRKRCTTCTSQQGRGTEDA